MDPKLLDILACPLCKGPLKLSADKSELVCVTLCANKEGVDLTELARRIAGAFNAKTHICQQL